MQTPFGLGDQSLRKECAVANLRVYHEYQHTFTAKQCECYSLIDLKDPQCPKLAPKDQSKPKRRPKYSRNYQPKPQVWGNIRLSKVIFTEKLFAVREAYSFPYRAVCGISG